MPESIHAGDGFHDMHWSNNGLAGRVLVQVTDGTKQDV
jgi:hypothetical protein